MSTTSPVSRDPLQRVRDSPRRQVFAALTAAAGTALLAADQGGFFPRSWPWAAAGFAAVAGLALLLCGRGRPARAAVALVAGLAASTGWTALSWAWSGEPQTSLQEAVRTPVYLAAALAFVVLATAGGSAGLLLGVAAGTAGVAAYSLADRALVGVHASDAQGSLLAHPLGYANALGVLCAIGLVVAAGLARPVRGTALALPAAAVVVLATALALTQSRASWAAAAAGLVVVATACRGRRAAAAAVGAAALGLLALSAWTAVSAPASLEARGDYWHAAWRAALAHPLLGGGAGTFDLAWAQWGDLARWGGALDAHSLYLESLAELGAVGLLLVLAALVPPVVAAVTAPRTVVRAAALGGATTFLLHAGLDWDWEMPAVTVAGLACLAAAAGPRERKFRPPAASSGGTTRRQEGTDAEQEAEDGSRGGAGSGGRDLRRGARRSLGREPGQGEGKGPR